MASPQLEESERLVADFGKRNTELEEQLSVLGSQVQEKDGGAKAREVERANFKLKWREGGKAPCPMFRYCDAVSDSNTVYCKYDRGKNLYAYHIPSSNWSPIPSGLTHGFALTVIDGLLTTVGGLGDDIKNTNKLYSLTGKGRRRRWTENYPPMPTKRNCVSPLCTGTALIVAGGMDDIFQSVKTVEVLNTETGQWHTAPDLPQPLSWSSITLCGDLVYLLGGHDKDDRPTNSVHSCSLSSLLLPPGSKSLGGRLVSTLTRSTRGSPWNRVADLPVDRSTAVNLRGRLLAVGGSDSDSKPRTAVHMYQPTTNSWELISHMTTRRSKCLAAVLPDNQLMVVGGETTGGKPCDSVEFGLVL